MINRRKFNMISGALGLSIFKLFRNLDSDRFSSPPLVITTWDNKAASSLAFDVLNENPDSILDAIEKGVNSVEEDPKNQTVGYGGMPDSSGKVSLDACIMDHAFNAGSVCYLRDIVHAVSVARLVMEKSDHVMLAGDGARDFALSNGFKKQKLLTPQARKAYNAWKKNPVYNPKINVERHDTVGMLALSAKGNLSGACSTSGLAFKDPGRVGDSPIIGSGLYVDNQHGAAVATGLGEKIMKSCSSFLIVEKMKQGLSPENACRYAVETLDEQQDGSKFQSAFIAINGKGEIGAYALQKGFVFTIADSEGVRVIESKSLY